MIRTETERADHYHLRTLELTEELAAKSREIRALREMLKERLFYADERFDRQGLSFTVEESTAFGDINHRNATLYPTADACIDAELKTWMQKPKAETEV